MSKNELIEITAQNKKTAEYVKKVNAKSYAEIGCNYGNTSYVVAKDMPEGSTIYLFDYPEYIKITKEKLKNIEKEKNLKIIYFSNSEKERDSYCWNLIGLVEKKQKIFDYVYLDGAHDFTIDGFAFFLIDRLLRVNGYIEFDDYNWTFGKSPTVNPLKDKTTSKKYTQKQINTPHIKLIVDNLIKPNKRYIEVVKNRVYKKIQDEPIRGNMEIIINKLKMNKL